MASVGYATLQIIPSMRGMATHLNDQLGRQMPGIGAQQGRKFADSFGSAIGQGARSVVSGVAGMVDGIGRTISSAAEVAGVAAGAVMGTSLLGGLRRVLDTEDARIMLRQMGLGAGDIERVLSDVDKTFEGTPFANPEGFNISAQLLASGVALEDVDDRLNTIANVTAQTMDKDLGRVGELFLKIAAAGKVTALETNQLAQMGIPIMQILAAGLGVTNDELLDMRAEGELTSDMFFDLLAGTDRFEGAARAMGSATRGAFMNVRTALARLGESFLGPLFGENGHAVQALLAIREALRGAAPAADELGKKFSGGLVDAIGAVRGALDLLFTQDATFENLNLMGIHEDHPAVDGLLSLGGAIEGARSAVAPLGAAFAAMAASGLSALPIIGRFIPVINPLAAALAAIVLTTPELREAFADLLEAVTPLALALGGAFLEAVTALAEGAVPVLLEVLELVTPAVQFLSDNAEIAAPIILGLASAMWALNAAMAANPVVLIVGAIVGYIAAIASLVKNWDEVVAWVERNPIAGLFVSQFLVVAGVIVYLGRLIEALPAIWETASTTINGHLITLILNVVAFAVSVVNAYVWLRDEVPKLVARMAAEVVAWFARLTFGVAETLASVVGTIRSQVRRWQAAAVYLAAQVVAGILAPLSALPGLVRSMVLNAIYALTGLAGDAYNAAKTVAGDLWAGFKDGLGIRSPSFIERAMDNIAASVVAKTNVLASEVGRMHTLAGDIPTIGPLTPDVRSAPIARGGDGASAAGMTIEQYHVHNPKPETEAESLPRAISRINHLAGA